MAPLISATVSSSPPRYFSSRSSEVSATVSRQQLAVLGGLLDEVGGDLLDGVLGAHLDVTLGVAAPGQRAHLDQVDDALEVVLRADRQLDDQRLGAEALDDRVDGEVEVGAELVHLVDEADAGDVVLVGLTPYGLGLGLNALLAVEHGDGAVEDAQRRARPRR